MQGKILLVEDEKTLAKALRFTLEKEGFAVAVAYDGEEATQALAADPPDLVILDLMLPKLDGFEVCRRLRRTGQTDAGGRKMIRMGSLQMDLIRHRVTVEDREVPLTAREYALLSFLASNPGRVYSREQLLEQVWGYGFCGDARTVDVHIRHLREKLEENPAEPRYLLTVWGSGYKFKEA